MITEKKLHTSLRSFQFQKERIKKRASAYKAADLSCIRAIAQAALNVELFTIPLYMCSMYSIQGMHQITSKDSNFYEGRYWPGAAPVANPDDSDYNARAFNLIFSVFIEEMLHLQLAANMSAMLSFTPNFTSPALQSDHYGWTCYQGTQIPHILDFKDCNGAYSKLNVQLAAMNREQIELFLAIEETETEAAKHIDPKYLPGGAEAKYFEEAPFDWWQPAYSEKDLPLFGSIGHMYLCYWSYLEITYDDGSSLLGILMNEKKQAQQRDQFNRETDNHPKKEYPGIDAQLEELSDIRYQFKNMINAITDQGEGNGVVQSINDRWQIFAPYDAVSKRFQPDSEALKKDYPGYNSAGKQTAISGQAYARSKARAIDHYEVFAQVRELLEKPGYQTWDQWHKENENNLNAWTAAMLNPSGKRSPYDIPTAQQVADALNNLKNSNAAETYETLSLAAVGTLKGITTQLNEYWKIKGNTTEFPNPAMFGSGDRVAICWAITGKVPQLSLNMKPLANDHLYHACQGMNLMGPHNPEAAADVGIFHSCKGSNGCKTQGGCGFVQSTKGGGSCSQSTPANNTDSSTTLMSAPANNKCGGLGGCAVPISASQLYPEPSAGDRQIMQVYNYGPEPQFSSAPIGEIHYKTGDPVYEIAWKAYAKVMEQRGTPVSNTRPNDSDIRLAMPPST